MASMSRNAKRLVTLSSKCLQLLTILRKGFKFIQTFRWEQVNSDSFIAQAVYFRFPVNSTFWEEDRTPEIEYCL